MRTFVKLALLAAAAVVVVAVVAQPAPPKEEPKPTDERFVVKVTPEMVRHTRIQNTLYFAGVAYSIGMLAFVLMSGLSRRMRDAAERVTKRPFVSAMIYVAFFTLVTTLIELPLAYYAGFMVPHQFDLTNQTLAAWIVDGLKALAVNLAISMPVGALALLVIRKFRRWWLPLWLGSIPIILLSVVIQPVLLDPIFNKFEPLKNERLRQELLTLASRAGIEHGRVYQVDKSKQTKTMNAYVTGIGPSARIVMWDTLLAKLDEQEVLAVMAHEMGHYVLNHMWKGLAFNLSVSLFVFLFGQLGHDRGLARWGSRWGVRGPGDPATLPWILTLLAVISFLLSPVMSAYSRRVEHEADVFSLELTHLNEPAATAFRKLAEDSKTDPDPSPFIEFWRYSHPPIAKRIRFALSYRPWETGQPNRVWKPR